MGKRVDWCERLGPNISQGAKLKWLQRSEDKGEIIERDFRCARPREACNRWHTWVFDGTDPEEGWTIEILTDNKWPPDWACTPEQLEEKYADEEQGSLIYRRRK